MGNPHESPPSRRFPWWVALAGPALGVSAHPILSTYFPPLDSAVRESRVAIAAIGIAAFLTYAIWRFARM
jgi:hypothetical protein